MIVSNRYPPYRESTEMNEKQQGLTLGLCSQYTVPDSFSCRHVNLSCLVLTPIRYATLHFRDRRGAVPLCYRIPTRYAFRASAKAIYPVVNMAFVFVLKKRPLREKK